MQLSKRLAAVAELVPEHSRLADVGTDHGYVPIWLLEEGRIDSALAMDVNKGPLQRADMNIRIHGLEEKITTRLSDGVSALKDSEADTIVIAGMGGALTIRILEEGKQVLQSVTTLVLQPQSEVALVRRYLHDQGYQIIEENMVFDEGKYYPMMKAVHADSEEISRWEAFEYKYGKLLIMMKHPVLKEFLDKEESSIESIREILTKQEGSHIERRLQEVTEDLDMILKAKESMNHEDE